MTKTNFREFESRPLNGGIQYRAFFPNGYGVSIVLHSFSYGGNMGLWEMAVLQGTMEESCICYDTPITSDVIGHLTESEVNELVDQVMALPMYTNEEDVQLPQDTWNGEIADDK